MKDKNRKKVLVISFTDLKKDPRVIKQIQWLSKDYLVTSLGLTEPDIDIEKKLTVKKKNIKDYFVKLQVVILLLFRRFDRFLKLMYQYSHLIHELKQEEFDLIVANELTSLHLLECIKGNAKVIFDAHEFYPDEKSNSAIHKLLFHSADIFYLKKYSSKVDQFCTVTKGLGEGYKRFYDRANMNVLIITNASDYVEHLSPSATKLPLKCVHHGNCAPSKNISTLVKAAVMLPRQIELTLMLVMNTHKSKIHFEELKSLARGYDNIKFVAPVPYAEICQTINQYDVGLYLLPSITHHNTYALPNKFFEFVQGRLAVITGPSPEMQGLINQYDLGVVTDGFTPEDLSRALQKLTKEDVDNYKNNSHANARILSSEGNRLTFLNAVERLLNIR